MSLVEPAIPAPPPPYPEQLSAWYEDLARLRPERYRFELAALALLGYVYVTGVALTLLAVGGLALLGGPIGYVFSATCLFTAARLVWTFWGKPQDPPGAVLAADTAGPILDLADRASAALRCPPPRRVIVSLDCNAAVTATTRDAHRTLLLGMPLLLALSLPELCSAIAHELGHVSHKHGRFGAWIYHVRATWERLAQLAGQSGGPVAWLLNLFATWYWPRFSACSLVRAREFERQADREAVALAGATASATGLARTVVTDARLDDRFWPALSLHAGEAAVPPADVCERMAGELAAPDPEEKERLERALAFRTMYWDTHPSLGDRVASFGVSLDALPPVERRAADELLGARLPALMRALNESWSAAVAATWSERHEALKAGRTRVAAIESETPGAPREVEDDWERASWTEELSGPEAALPLYRALLERAPDHRSAQLALGRLLLLRKDPEGARLVDAARVDPWLTIPAANLLYDHYASQQLHDEADRYHRLAAAHADVMEKAAAERSTFTRSDTIAPHGLERETLERLLRQIRSRRDVAEAYLVRKQVTTFPEKPCFIVGVCQRNPWYRITTPWGGQNLLQELVESVHFGEPLLFVGLDQDRGLLKKVQRVEGARVLPD